MPKIQYNKKQYTLTVPKELIKQLGWGKNTEVLISKYPEKNIIFIEKIKRGSKNE
jgi:bifunctional DNA-binding transcriptional regulator/antitoxin component of YhaV-PrlF toxin-antitoxin module